MTIKIANQLNQNGQYSKTKEELLLEYTKAMENHAIFNKDVIEFSELMAKHPADVFIIPSFEAGKPCEQIRQGDVYLFRKGEKDEGTLDNIMYAKYKNTISELKETESRNLQFGESITGDHKIIPLKNTNIKVYDCTIELPIKVTRGSNTYKVKLVKADGPFGVFHSEHGNITCPKGTYLACVQLDARSLTRMRD